MSDASLLVLQSQIHEMYHGIIRDNIERMQFASQPESTSQLDNIQIYEQCLDSELQRTAWIFLDRHGESRQDLNTHRRWIFGYISYNGNSRSLSRTHNIPVELLPTSTVQSTIGFNVDQIEVHELGPSIGTPFKKEVTKIYGDRLSMHNFGSPINITFRDVEKKCHTYLLKSGSIINIDGDARLLSWKINNGRNYTDDQGESHKRTQSLLIIYRSIPSLYTS